MQKLKPILLAMHTWGEEFQGCRSTAVLILPSPLSSHKNAVK